MLDHGLEIAGYALKLRQSHLLPAGATPESQAAQAEAWTAGTAYAALLHDLGKIAVDLHVEYTDGHVWHPWHGPLRYPYHFRYRKDREYRLHGAATGLLYTQVLDPDILDWLSDYPDLWSALLYVLAGQYEHAGTLGELVIKADQASVAQALGGDPSKALAAPRHALQRKLLDGLRYLLREELKINQPQASDGWLTGDVLWLVSKTVSDKLRAHLLSQGIEGIPANNTAVFNVLQDHGIAQPTPDGRAIWRATITSEAGWSHTFTLLRLAPALIWEGDNRPVPFTGTVTLDESPPEDGSPAAPAAAPTSASPPATPEGQPHVEPGPQLDPVAALLSMFEAPESTSETVAGAEPAPLPATAPDIPVVLAPSGPAPATLLADTTPSGGHFLTWLRQGIQSRKLIINDAKALVHTVADMLALLKQFIEHAHRDEHPELDVSTYHLAVDIASDYGAMLRMLPPEQRPQAEGDPGQFVEHLLRLASRMSPKQLATSKRKPKVAQAKGYVDGTIARSHVSTARVLKKTAAGKRP